MRLGGGRVGLQTHLLVQLKSIERRLEGLNLVLRLREASVPLDELSLLGVKSETGKSRRVSRLVRCYKKQEPY